MRRTYRIDDMSHERRWPRFAAAAQAHGIQSMLGYRLFTSRRTLGAIDLYATQPSAFDANAEIVGELFAAHEPPRNVRRLHFLERLESCQVVHRGGTRRSCVSGR
jgi:hypothetical protein